MSEPIVPYSVDDATYIGNEDDGCYYQVAEGEDGWYVTVVVDCDTAHFVDDLICDDGPYDTEEEAIAAGKDVAWGWLSDNGIEVEQEDEL